MGEVLVVMVKCNNVGNVFGIMTRVQHLFHRVGTSVSLHGMCHDCIATMLGQYRISCLSQKKVLIMLFLSKFCSRPNAKTEFLNQQLLLENPVNSYFNPTRAFARMTEYLVSILAEYLETIYKDDSCMS